MKLEIRNQMVDIPDSDMWIHQQSGRRVITHAGIQKLGEIFKLQILEPKILIAPTEENGGLVAIQVAVKEGDKITYEIHEASDQNTTSVSRSYKVRMAFKRAYDKAILSAIGLYDVSSDIEEESNGEAPKYQKKRDREAPKPIAKPVVKPIPIEKLRSNGGTKNGVNSINSKILAKIEEISKELQIEARVDFKDSGEATAYLNELLGKLREAKVRGE